MRLIGLLVSLGLIASTGKVVNFDTAPLGKTPPGWTVAMTSQGAPPQWEILKDKSAPTQPYVLAQVSGGPSNRAPLAILNEPRLRDGEISVRLKPVSGREDRGGGVVWRYQDPENYYLARANAANNTVTVYKVERGRRLQLLPSAKHDVPVNVWSILKVAARGNRYQVYMDHRRILEGRDGTFTAAGKVGVATLGDSVTYFDDFRVNPK